MKKNRIIPVTIKSGRKIKLNSDTKQSQSPFKKEINPKKKKKHFHIFSVLLKIIGLFFLVLIIFAAIIFFIIIKDLPRPQNFTENEMIESTKIYDRTGEILLSDVYNEEKRTYVPLSQIPLSLQQAVIATEDNRFYTHFGIDPSGVMRALYLDITQGKTQGASTIDQQLIRSTFLTPDKTLKRKIKEIVLAIELDRRYSKNQILEWYLNQVPFGINIYGAEEASLTYFQKPIQDISLPEAAMLAAIIQMPSYYSPYGDHWDKLMVRKNFVLQRMREEGYITSEEEEKAAAEKIEIAKVPNKTLAYHFVTYAKQQIEEQYGADFLQTKGLRIYTTLDWNLQKEAEEIVKENVAKNRINFNAYNAAVVVLSPKTGEVLAMIGSADPYADPLPKGCDPATTCKFVPSYNVAVQGVRQPGSSFKPIIYAAAFRNGATPDTVVVDEPVNYNGYAPNNYDGRFRGPLTLRSALAQSLNIPAIKVLNDYAGLSNAIELAKLMGITTLGDDTSRYGLSFALGAADVRVIDMATAYGVLANGGYYIEPSVILRIEDSQGNILYQNNKTPRKVLEKNVCDMVTDILSDNNARAPMFGAHSLLRFDDYKVAVKTGTTQESQDGWTIGYTEDVVVSVWAGNNNHARMSAIGEQAAGPIWRAIILKAIELKAGEVNETSEPVEPGTEVPLVPD
ncbi:MAG TPA: PBP1A family penicillin-binding protein [Candidatus Pacearchaeota archaeon]|nr:PBP1A family penicillin-binding protein [Candidatus Pacearchaeota archaeon]HRR95032.1 PBP1A family penicillin-binding protein [Candidatus Paceibacterota bacterium]HPC30785.1 PBP1A family penicillin-binding protein [Candidatus Pacearchaeota archaeon]HQG09074.1 PBP1A family penicillin-binding protein [Candidatus Pacearchaeota archaeon]HQH20028.1 PBP1A family penicillin-binding protein [Candidatus Pacearchaeota archaeon]